jgi:alpha-ketoglutarate-dependent taurine dioxygenase
MPSTDAGDELDGLRACLTERHQTAGVSSIAVKNLDPSYRALHHVERNTHPTGSPAQLEIDAARARCRTAGHHRTSPGKKIAIQLTGDQFMIREPKIIERDSTYGSAWTANLSELRSRRDELEQLLYRHGVLLFRGFPVDSPSAFEAFATAVDPAIDHYIGSTDRGQIAGKVYESTRIPGLYLIPLHSETSYANFFPSRGFFHCVRPADEGGETLFADNRRILDALPGKLLNDLRTKGVYYVRNIPTQMAKVVKLSRKLRVGIVKGWEEMFRTSDPRAVEKFCREQHMPFSWDDGWLSLSTKLPATRVHPVTKEEVWFNQAHLFLVSAKTLSLPASLLIHAMSAYAGRELVGCRFGDNTPVEAEDMLRVTRTLESQSFKVSWRKGDVVLFDNLLMSHGRSKFKGKRDLVSIFSGYRSGDAVSATTYN